jgi:hypothetical protein
MAATLTARECDPVYATAVVFEVLNELPHATCHDWSVPSSKS